MTCETIGWSWTSDALHYPLAALFPHSTATRMLHGSYTTVTRQLHDAYPIAISVRFGSVRFGSPDCIYKNNAGEKSLPDSSAHKILLAAGTHAPTMRINDLFTELFLPSFKKKSDTMLSHAAGCRLGVDVNTILYPLCRRSNDSALAVLMSQSQHSTTYPSRVHQPWNETSLCL